MTRRARALLCAAVGLLAVGGCASDDQDLAPCPSAKVLGEPSQLTRFAEGPGRDAVDIQFEASFTRVAGECSYSKGGGDVDVELTVVIDVARGAAAEAGRVAFRYFVAVTERPGPNGAERSVLARTSFPVEVTLPQGGRGLRYTDVLDISIPRPTGRDVRDYVLYLGFELTAEELSYNRENGLR